MSVKDTYNDLLKEIEYLEIYIEDLQREQKRIKNILETSGEQSNLTASYGKERVQTSPINYILLHVEQRYEEIFKILKPLRELLQKKLQTKRQLEDKLSEFEGLEYKVAYMRDIKGMRLRDIAKELNYTHDWIRKVSSRTRHIKGTDKGKIRC